MVPHPQPPVAYNCSVSVFCKHKQDRPNDIATDWWDLRELNWLVVWGWGLWTDSVLTLSRPCTADSKIIIICTCRYASTSATGITRDNALHNAVTTVHHTTFHHPTVHHTTFHHPTVHHTVVHNTVVHHHNLQCITLKTIVHHLTVMHATVHHNRVSDPMLNPP